MTPKVGEKWGHKRYKTLCKVLEVTLTRVSVLCHWIPITYLFGYFTEEFEKVEE